MSFKSPEGVLRQALIDNATVAAEVGNRIYPVLAPSSSALPFITYRRVGIQREQTLSAPMGVPRVTVEMGCLATTYEAARELADAVRQVLDGYGGTADNTEVKQVHLDNELDDFVQLTGSDLPPVYQVTQTYDVWWQET
jgi:hypothetical protein